MIRINLLPHDAGSKKAAAKAGAAAGAGGSALVTILIALIGLTLVGGSGYASWTIYSETTRLQNEDAELKKTVAKLEKQRDAAAKEYEDLRAKYEKAVAKIRVLLMLDPPDRILFAEKLNMIADIRPDGIALTEVQLIENVEMIETSESVDKRKAYDKMKKEERQRLGLTAKPQPIKVPNITQTLSIKGIAFDTVQAKRITDISDFRKNLESHFITTPTNSIRRFKDGFVDEVAFGDFNDVNDYLETGRRVTEFQVIFNTKAMTIQKADDLIAEMKKDLERRKRIAAQQGVHRPATPPPATPPPPAAPPAEEEPAADAPTDEKSESN